jgi:ABC-type spermidine/putrescine transport system permease subunit I
VLTGTINESDSAYCSEDQTHGTTVFATPPILLNHALPQQRKQEKMLETSVIVKVTVFWHVMPCRLVYMVLIFHRKLQPPSCRSGVQNFSKLFGARLVTRSVFHTEDLQNLVATATWRL